MGADGVLVPAREVLPLDRHPVGVYLAGLVSAASRDTQRSALTQIAKRLCPGVELFRVPWWLLTYGPCVALVSVLVREYSPSTVGRMLSAFRGVLRASFLLGLLPGEVWASLRELKVPGRASALDDRERTGRGLSSGELRALLATCDPRTCTGTRNAAILSLLYGAGLRRAEVASLELSQLDTSAWTVRVLGKGRRWRTVPLGAEGVRWAMLRWLELRGEVPGPLFLRLQGKRALQGVALGGAAVGLVVEVAAQQAGLGRVRAHDLRRSYVSDLLDRGADVVLVADLVGHVSVRTTARYDRRPARARAQASTLIDVPVRREDGDA